jgi:hypothetical protein
MFSYARNSCSRNHRRYTLCGYHSANEHEGDWKTCPECRKDFITEMYVWYGTNEYNFTKLKNPPSYEPTKCTDCGRVIALATDGYSLGSDGYQCEECAAREMDKKMRQSLAEKKREQVRQTSEKALAKMNVLSFPKFTPQARTRWNKIPKPAQDGILQSVWCSSCKGSAMKLESGRMERGMLILEGTCVKCGNTVVRTVEPEE